MSVLQIVDLHASVSGKKILNGITLAVSSGEVHAVMGPNGAGKSTLAAVLMGRPGYEVISGSVTLDGVDMLSLPAWQRAQAGLHLVMQYPSEVPGVSLDHVMEQALIERGRSTEGLDQVLESEAARIGFSSELLHRALNVDLSGGEKKRNETLQLAVLRPSIAILDELDSGLDIDALRDCASRVEALTNETGLGALVITHYNRLLEALPPDVIHVLVKGRIVATGGPELADELERSGYEAYAVDEPGPASSSALDDLFAH
ncbi:MAG: Fe-S cluster assembly ATP-binding protein [Acidimicrobiaceae bacterium]|nr:MAG: Fe-S cluster assembly ATP-binding protein [Acidimicrobiaceae bacterium]